MPLLLRLLSLLRHRNSLKFLLRASFHLILHLTPPVYVCSLFHSFLTPTHFAMKKLLNSVLGAEFNKTPAQRGLTPDNTVYLLAFSAKLTRLTAPLLFATTPDDKSLRGSLDSHDPLCNEELDGVAIRSPVIHQQFKTVRHLQHFITADGVLETIGQLVKQRVLPEKHGRNAGCRPLAQTSSGIGT